MKERALIQQHGLRYVLISGLAYVPLLEVSLDDWLAVWLVENKCRLCCTEKGVSFKQADASSLSVGGVVEGRNYFPCK